MLFPSGMQQFLVREKYRQSMTYLALRLKCYNHAEAIFALKFASVQRPAGELAALLRTAYLDLGASSRQSKTEKGGQGRDSGEGIIMDPPLPMVHHLLSIYISGPWAIDSAAHSRTCSEIIKLKHVLVFYWFQVERIGLLQLDEDGMLPNNEIYQQKTLNNFRVSLNI